MPCDAAIRCTVHMQQMPNEAFGGTSSFCLPASNIDEERQLRTAAPTTQDTLDDDASNVAGGCF